jgi:energy-converting hydrogenase A subunit R
MQVRRAFISDCEGPISKNDNAFELAAHYIPRGGRLFAIVSRYDDLLSILKRPGHEVGSTLKLIIPFLKAYGLTDEEARRFSARTLALMPDAKEAMQRVRRMAPAFIVSTSYEHYMEALCQALGFPLENVYCTKASFDEYDLSPEEEGRLRRLAEEVADMPILEAPAEVSSIEELPEGLQRALRRLDEIFWGEVRRMKVGRALDGGGLIGGRGKAEAVEQVARRLGVGLDGIMYVGDSITDVEAFAKVRAGGGLAVSFNGNRYAVRSSDVAVMSRSSLTIAVIAELFIRLGRDGALEALRSWSLRGLRGKVADERLLERVFEAPRGPPKVEVVAAENVEELAAESERFRREVRGEVIGRLG